MLLIVAAVVLRLPLLPLAADVALLHVAAGLVYLVLVLLLLLLHKKIKVIC
jgi:hypothetical protein